MSRESWKQTTKSRLLCLVSKWSVSKKRSCWPTGGLYAVPPVAACDEACEGRCAKHTRTRHVMRSTHRVRYGNAGYTPLCCIPFLMRAVTQAVRRKPASQEQPLCSSGLLSQSTDACVEEAQHPRSVLLLPKESRHLTAAFDAISDNTALRSFK